MYIFARKKVKGGEEMGEDEPKVGRDEMDLQTVE
jgi:hypothetical protein